MENKLYPLGEVEFNRGRLNDRHCSFDTVRLADYLHSGMRPGVVYAKEEIQIVVKMEQVADDKRIDSMHATSALILATNAI